MQSNPSVILAARLIIICHAVSAASCAGLGAVVGASAVLVASDPFNKNKEEYRLYGSGSITKFHLESLVGDTKRQVVTDLGRPTHLYFSQGMSESYYIYEFDYSIYDGR